MAESLLTNISSALSLTFADTLARQFNRSAVLGGLLPSKPGSGGGNGKSHNWDVEMDGATAGSYAEGDDVASSEFAVDTLVPAVLPWAAYRSAFWVSQLQLDAAASSVGVASALNRLLGERILSSCSKLSKLLNQDMWAGTGTDGSGNPTIVGLTGGSLLNTGNYAGLSRVTYPLWKGNVLANGGIPRALTTNLLNQADEAIFNKASGMQADLIVMDSASYTKYQGLFTPIHRVEGERIGSFDPGVSSLFFKGIPVHRDVDAPAGTIAFLNTKHVKKLWVPPSSEFGMNSVMSREVMGAGFNGESEVGELDLPFRVQALAQGGDSVKIMVYGYFQMEVDRPNCMALIQDVDVA